MSAKRVSCIFDKNPNQWGLRGDPYLWEEMKEYFVSDFIPYSLDDFSRKASAFVETVTGERLSNDKTYYVRKYDRGGMSSGKVSGECWQKKLIPLLMERLNIENAESECTRYRNFWPIDISDVAFPGGERIYIFNRGMLLLEVHYPLGHIISAHMYTDSWNMIGICVDVTYGKTLLYSSEILTDEYYLRQSLEVAKKTVSLSEKDLNVGNRTIQNELSLPCSLLCLKGIGREIFDAEKIIVMVDHCEYAQEPQIIGDKSQISEICDSITDMTVSEKTDLCMSTQTTITYIFYIDDKNSVGITFQNGMLLYNNELYSIDGYKKLSEVSRITVNR